ncbi:hypothetical protein ACFQMA_01540 [Halosimplex aquaticum]|uniref:TFIIS-type domain-containing protein n=1 Tax=Halosimplex aquaticum TaxID=3026162 RepID=A0ABD5XY32_9EURY|nr:hypothetical protein [Halosimplex aquaticum]
MVESTQRGRESTASEITADKIDKPIGKLVTCLQCDSDAHAIVLRKTVIVSQDAETDGKVWVDCFDCGNGFLVHNQMKSADPR